ncbi:unnamed protein product, partial [Brassica rapa]
MKQMKTVDLETFGGTVDHFQAYNWKHRLATCLQTINCPLRLCLNIAEFLEDLVEKAAVQEACIAREQKYSKAQPKTERTS